MAKETYDSRNKNRYRYSSWRCITTAELQNPVEDKGANGERKKAVIALPGGAQVSPSSSSSFNNSK